MTGRAATLYGIRGTYAVLTFALGAIVARTWGTETFGRFSLMWTVVVVATIVGGAGSGSYLIEMFPQLDSSEFSRLAQRLALVALGMGVLGSLLAMPVLMALDALPLATLSVLPASLHSMLNSGLIAQSKQLFAGFLDGVARPVITLGVVLLAGWQGWSPELALTSGLVFGYTITAGISAAITLPRRRVVNVESRTIALPPILGPLSTFAGIGLLVTLMAQGDRFVLNHLGSVVDVAHYAAAQNTSNIVIYGVNSISSLALPQLAEAINSNKSQAVNTSVDRLIRSLILISAASGLIAALFGQRLLVVFGPGFTNARWPLAILLFGMCASLTFGFPVSVMSMSWLRRWVLVHLSCGVVVMMVIASILVPFLGATGAALANAIAAVVVRAAIHVQLGRAGLPTYWALSRGRSTTRGPLASTLHG